MDPDTGFVRFGWRDYDPAVGRFTAPDPLGDTGGDHDVYEYCVDDPVSCVDPTGLWFLPALAWAYRGTVALADSYPYLAGAAGGALGLGLGLGGSYLAAAGVDKWGSHYAPPGMRNNGPQKESTAARDAVKAVAPAVAATHAAGLAPEGLLAAPEVGLAANALLQRMGPTAIGAAMTATGAAAPADKFERRVQRLAQFIEGTAVPTPPHGGSLPGMLGGAITEIVNRILHIQEQGGLWQQQKQNGKK